MQCWYLDDGTILGDSVEVSKAFNIIKEEGHVLGLVMNVSKTELYWPKKDPRISELNLFHEDMSYPMKGVKLPGGGVSTNEEFIMEMATKRAIRSKTLMEAVRKLEDPQMELILLRACIGVSKLLFALRTSPPESFMDAENIVDTAIRESLEHIVTGGGPGFGEMQFRLATIPIRYGGLGVLTVSDVKRYAYLASYIQSQELQMKILNGTNG